MKKKIGLLIVALGLAGCGMSQKQLKEMDALLTQAQTAECDRVKAYLALVQTEVQKKLDK